MCSPCLAASHSILHTLVYQPASQLGLFQGLEAALYLGLAAGMVDQVPSGLRTGVAHIYPRVPLPSARFPLPRSGAPAPG